MFALVYGFVLAQEEILELSRDRRCFVLPPGAPLPPLSLSPNGQILALLLKGNEELLDIRLLFADTRSRKKK